MENSKDLMEGRTPNMIHDYLFLSFFFLSAVLFIKQKSDSLFVS